MSIKRFIEELAEALEVQNEGLDSVNSFSQISFQPLGSRSLTDYDFRQWIIL